MAQPALPGALDDSEQQLPADALSLRLRGNRERPDIRLRFVLREFVSQAERLKRDRPEDAAPRLAGCDEHHAAVGETESAQCFGIPAAFRQQPQRPVRRHPQLSNRHVLIGPRLPDNHWCRLPAGCRVGCTTTGQTNLAVTTGTPSLEAKDHSPDSGITMIRSSLW